MIILFQSPLLPLLQSMLRQAFGRIATVDWHSGYEAQTLLSNVEHCSAATTGPVLDGWVCCPIRSEDPMSCTCTHVFDLTAWRYHRRLTGSQRDGAGSLHSAQASCRLEILDAPAELAQIGAASEAEPDEAPEQAAEGTRLETVSRASSTGERHEGGWISVRLPGGAANLPAWAAERPSLLWLRTQAGATNALKMPAWPANTRAQQLNAAAASARRQTEAW